MEPANRKSDLRVIKTKRAIHTAFAELLTEKDMDDITVTDIASRAIINRKTFYNNYRGVYELVDELENEVIRTFDTAMREIDFVENPYAVFMKLTEIINSDMDFYGALLRSSRNAGLTHKIRLTLQQKAQERFESRIDLPPERISVMMDYAVSGMVRCIRAGSIPSAGSPSRRFPISPAACASRGCAARRRTPG